jgi:hypothetical protein
MYSRNMANPPKISQMMFPSIFIVFTITIQVKIVLISENM